jgi:NADH-quinone oxidoreductase subunit A
VVFDFANILVFSVVAAGFVVVNLLAGRLLLRPRSGDERSKREIYECGEPSIGQAWIRFDIRFYTVALMFVVFDVEIALLFPWGVVFRDLVERGLGSVAFLEAGTFIVILLAGLFYVWARGDIEWTPREGERTVVAGEPRGAALPAPPAGREPAAGVAAGGGRHA